MRPTEEQRRGVDVMLAMGWPDAGDLVQRRLGAASFVVCASPSYWSLHGMPSHPIGAMAALTDWENLEVVPVNLLYPASVRRILRVRLVIDFITQLFNDFEQRREARAPGSARPHWARKGGRRASAALPD